MKKSISVKTTVLLLFFVAIIAVFGTASVMNYFQAQDAASSGSSSSQGTVTVYVRESTTPSTVGGEVFVNVTNETEDAS